MPAKEAQPTQEFIEIEDIKKDTVFLKNGALRRVLMVSGVNFDLKSEDEQNIIIFSYQKFLNSLDFSLQMVVHSRKMNIDQYLENLGQKKDEEGNALIQNQMDEYIRFVRSLVELNEVMTKTFFVVVPYDPINIPGVKSGKLSVFGLGKKKANHTAAEEETLAQRMQQLGQRVENVINGLTQIGLRAVVMNEQELIELYYNLYNPRATEKRGIKLEQLSDNKHNG